MAPDETRPLLVQPGHLSYQTGHIRQVETAILCSHQVGAQLDHDAPIMAGVSSDVGLLQSILPHARFTLQPQPDYINHEGLQQTPIARLLLLGCRNKRHVFSACRPFLETLHQKTKGSRYPPSYANLCNWALVCLPRSPANPSGKGDLRVSPNTGYRSRRSDLLESVVSVGWVKRGGTHHDWSRRSNLPVGFCWCAKQSLPLPNLTEGIDSLRPQGTTAL